MDRENLDRFCRISRTPQIFNYFFPPTNISPYGRRRQPIWLFSVRGPPALRVNFQKPTLGGPVPPERIFEFFHRKNKMAQNRQNRIDLKFHKTVSLRLRVDENFFRKIYRAVFPPGESQFKFYPPNNNSDVGESGPPTFFAPLGDVALKRSWETELAKMRGSPPINFLNFSSPSE
jgi:hypothetical protein